jgi:hypothetical protein
MKDELTDLMHSEFFSDPDEKRKILIMSAFSRIRRGEPKLAVLQRLELTEDEYDENVGRVFLDWVNS